MAGGMARTLRAIRDGRMAPRQIADEANVINFVVPSRAANQFGHAPTISTQ
jgi:hypothetical protein